MTREQAKRKYKLVSDVNLKLLRTNQVNKIKKQRAAFQSKVFKQQERAEQALRSKGDTKLQDKFTTKQLSRRQTQIKRNIAKTKKLKYNNNGGDIAFRDVSTDKEN